MRVGPTACPSIQHATTAWTQTPTQGPSASRATPGSSKSGPAAHRPPPAGGAVARRRHRHKADARVRPHRARQRNPGVPGLARDRRGLGLRIRPGVRRWRRDLAHPGRSAHNHGQSQRQRLRSRIHREEPRLETGVDRPQRDLSAVQCWSGSSTSQTTPSISTVC